MNLLCPSAWELVQHKAEVYDAHHAQPVGAEFACCQAGFAKYHAIIIDNIGYVQQSRAERTVARILARQGLKNISGSVFTTGK